MDVGTISSIIIWIIGGLAMLIVWAVSFAFSTREKLSLLNQGLAVMERDVKAQREIVDHLTRTGENIKVQLGQQMNDINVIKNQIGSLATGQDKIFKQLELYNENITRFYRDFDLTKKDKHD